MENFCGARVACATGQLVRRVWKLSRLMKLRVGTAWIILNQDPRTYRGIRSYRTYKVNFCWETRHKWRSQWYCNTFWWPTWGPDVDDEEDDDDEDLLEGGDEEHAKGDDDGGERLLFSWGDGVRMGFFQLETRILGGIDGSLLALKKGCNFFWQYQKRVHLLHEATWFITVSRVSRWRSHGGCRSHRW